MILKTTKGFTGNFSLLILWSVGILLIVAVAPLLSKVDFNNNIEGVQRNSLDKYSAYSTTAALLTQEDVRERIGLGDENVKSEIDEGLDSSGLAENEYNYFVQDSKIGAQSGEPLIGSIDPQSDSPYISVYIASPDRNVRRFSFQASSENFETQARNWHRSGFGVYSGG